MGIQHGAPARLRSLAAALAVAALVAVPSAVAVAAPAPPTDKDVRDARAAVTGVERSVAALEVRLAQQSVERDAAEVAVQRAAEEYTRAEVARVAAAETAAVAAARSESADAAAEDARRTLVAVARQSARSGGSMDTVQAFLSADGFEEIIERSNALARVSTRSDQAVQTFTATRLVATTLKARSDAAAEAQESATRVAQDALAGAEQTWADAEAALAAADAERDQLIAELAVARSTSAAVETARQDQLDRERVARADAAAEAVRRGESSSGSTGGSAGSGSAGSGSTGGGSGSTGSTGGGSTGGGTVPTPAPTAAPTAAPTTPPTTPPTGKYGLGTGTSRGGAGQGQAAVDWAVARSGLPYLWGGTGPDAYDCSGLTMGGWKAAGVNLNRTSRDQYKQVLKISYNDMRPGDLVFWGTDVNNPDSITHVALWMGNNTIVEAPRPGVPVRVTAMRWSGTMLYAGRA